MKPFRLHWFPRLRSTNDQATALRNRNELFAPAIVLTGKQVAGRGRGRHTWWSGAGSLTITFALPISEHVQPHQLPLVAGLAVREALGSFCEPSVAATIQLKWPNDLLVNGKKLAGLLCERVRRVDLIGVGVNVNVCRRDVPAALRSDITSLDELSHRFIPMNSVVISLCKHLLARLARPGDHHFPTILGEYHAHHALVGRRIRVESSPDERTPHEGIIVGKCVGLDEMGRLLLKDGKITRHIIAGSVRMI